MEQRDWLSCDECLGASGTNNDRKPHVEYYIQNESNEEYFIVEFKYM